MELLLTGCPLPRLCLAMRHAPPPALIKLQSPCTMSEAVGVTTCRTLAVPMSTGVDALARHKPMQGIRSAWRIAQERCARLEAGRYGSTWHIAQTLRMLCNMEGRIVQHGGDHCATQNLRQKLFARNLHPGELQEFSREHLYGGHHPPVPSTQGGLRQRSLGLPIFCLCTRLPLCWCSTAYHSAT